jgi:dTDP-L-rhamnose 4-epimerase
MCAIVAPRVQPEIAPQHRAGDIRHCFADLGEAIRLNYTPAVSLTEGLREFVRHADIEQPCA